MINQYLKQISEEPKTQSAISPVGRRCAIAKRLPSGLANSLTIKEQLAQTREVLDRAKFLVANWSDKEWQQDPNYCPF